MKALILALALGAAPAHAVLSGTPQDSAGAILQRDQLNLLGAVQDWGDYLSKTQPQIKAKYSPELAQIKAAAEAAKTIEQFRPIELRLDAWKKALKFELFPFLTSGWSVTSSAVALAQSQVEAFQAVDKLRQSAITSEQKKQLDDLLDRIRVAADVQSLDRVFDNAGYSRPAPTPQLVFGGAYGGAYSGSSALSPYRSLKINEVPSPLSLDAADRARYAKVSEVLRGRGASQQVIDMTISEAVRQNVDPLLVLALVQTESAFRAGATSSVGARGLMQIMPATGRGLGVSNADQLYNPQTNLKAGVRFLKGLWNKFVDISFSALSSIDPFSSADVKKAIAAYNAGPGAVQKYGGVPPYRETQGYVVKVLKTYMELRALFNRSR